MANHLRQNIMTRQWVIYAPVRGERPEDFQDSHTTRRELPTYDPLCPFCPGNEDKLPTIIAAEQVDDEYGWQTRIVPNKFPALTPDQSVQRTRHNMFVTMPGFGRHEVIIEHPCHNYDIAQMAAHEIDIIIETYHRRYVELMNEHDNMLTLIFRNHGERAGTSLLHPHSQIVVTGVVPQHIRWREMEAQRYFDQWGRCVVCDMLAFEGDSRERLLWENGSFLAFVPFAAEVPFEVWIVPKRHQADFGDIRDQEKADLARTLQNVLSRLHRKLDDPDYNYIINTAARYRSGEPQLHWYFLIRPRLKTRAGFEIGSGISINPSLPEENAAFLRKD